MASEAASQAVLRVLPDARPEIEENAEREEPATPWTTPDAIASWKPKRIVSQPPALQPQAASMIHTNEPRIAVRMR